MSKVRPRLVTYGAVVPIQEAKPVIVGASATVKSRPDEVPNAVVATTVTEPEATPLGTVKVTLVSVPDVTSAVTPPTLMVTLLR